MYATSFHKSQQLADSDLLPLSSSCPVCLHTGDRRIVFRVQEMPLVEMKECSRCGACSASRMPAPEVLDRYYSSYYAPGGAKVTFFCRKAFARHILKHARIESGQRLRLLDFGGGDGSLAIEIARQLVESGRASLVQIDLVDYESPCAPPNSAITIRQFRRLEEAEGSYDLVLASAILEHIPDVHAVMVKLFQLVRDGGWFYARTPWVLPLASVVPNLDITFPAHVHDMGNTFWSRVPEVFGLRTRFCRSATSPVETGLRGNLVRTLAAYVMKFPSHVEHALSPASRTHRTWKLVGGWEFVCQC